jgi:Tol biopolymer transport system component
MGHASPSSPSENPTEDRLGSWKEIAEYLRRDVTTVQRWEKREGMPVHRQLHDKMGSVYAYRADLDAWLVSRSAKKIAISPDGNHVAFVAAERGRSILYEMQADGTNARIITDFLDLQGSPAWAPDGKSITVALDDHGIPHLVRVPLGGGLAVPLTKEYSLDPAWTPDGSYVVYSSADIGTKFSVKAIAPGAAA